MKTYYWRSGGSRCRWVSATRSGRLTPRKRAPGTHWIGGWVSPIVGLDAVARRMNPRSYRESNPGRPAHILVTILIELPWIPFTTLRSYNSRQLKIFLPRHSVCHINLSCIRLRGSGNSAPVPASKSHFRGLRSVGLSLSTRLHPIYPRGLSISFYLRNLNLATWWRLSGPITPRHVSYNIEMKLLVSVIFNETQLRIIKFTFCHFQFSFFPIATLNVGKIQIS
jgi:hypothetical protein